MMDTLKRLAAVLLCLCMALTLAACGGLSASEEETADSLTRAASATGAVTAPEDMDATARFATKKYDSDMYVVFNGIAKRDTGYFSAPGGTVTITTTATGESTGMKSFKINMWKKVDGGAQYVENTTIYYYTDGGTYSYTISGLDPADSYKLTLSYDANGYYIYGVMHVEGIGELGALPEESETGDAA